MGASIGCQIDISDPFAHVHQLIVILNLLMCLCSKIHASMVDIYFPCTRCKLKLIGSQSWKLLIDKPISISPSAEKSLL